MEAEDWELLSLPAIAEKDEHYRLITPHGERIITRERC
jgi:hypothetical protein